MLNNNRWITVLVLAASCATTADSQQAATPPAQAAAPSAPAWSPSKDIGVFVFGRNGQSGDQQLKDESDCYGSAKQQSGIDPKAPAPAGKTSEQKQEEQKAAAKDADTPSGGRLKGAARGAAGGAAIGAIAGDAGKGAGAGAVAGTMRGGMKQREASAAAQKEAAAKVAAQQKADEDRAKLAHAEGLDTFQRAFSACMDARNYSVK
jgi:Glycine-zipper domain